MTSPDTLVLRDLALEETLALRRRVMRDGREDAVVVFDADHRPGTWHTGALRDGVVVATATFLRAPCPERPEVERAVQLRMMAVAPEEQGRGVGRRVVEGAAERLRADADLLWCNARDSAIGFYERLGFTVSGDGFVTADTRLPHHVMVRPLR